MSKLQVHCLSMSLDGYVAGPDQDVDNPMGVGGMALHEWVFATAAGQRMMGREADGTEGVDSAMIDAGFTDIGATIMGRNMFGPIRGHWPDDHWTGWWGDEPPYHHPVFVLTHHARDPLEMAGGTTFHFVTDGIESALTQARAAAGDANIRLGGGAAAIQQYLRAGLIDLLHIALAPVVLGSGERLFEGADLVPAGYAVEVTPGEGATHFTFSRS